MTKICATSLANAINTERLTPSSGSQLLVS